MTFKDWIAAYGSPGRLYDVATEAEIAGDTFSGFDDFRIEKFFDTKDEKERFIVSWKNADAPTDAPAAGSDFSESLEITQKVPAAKKRNLTPWLIAGAVLLLVIIISLFFFKKKK